MLLLQLPPSLRFDAKVAGRFFAQLRKAFGGALVCEPRHASWFTPEAEQSMRRSEIARAAVDPARWPGAELPGGHPGIAYFRWHGSPRIYWSEYSDDCLAQRARVLGDLPSGTARWCVFDNTASGAALRNALQLRSMLKP